MKPDRNLYSLAGDGLGNIYLDGRLLFSASEPGMRAHVIDGDLDGTGYSDALKLSGCARLHVIVLGRVIGGSEDVVDINHSSDCIVDIARSEPRGRYLATIKGGSSNISITTKQHGHGSEVDFDIGNWSDQGGGKRTTGVSIASLTDDGSPVSVRVLHGWSPRLIGPGRYRLNGLFRGVFYRIYGLLKGLM